MKSVLMVSVALGISTAGCSSQMQRSSPVTPSYLAANPLTKPGITGVPYFLPDTVVPITVAGEFVALPGRKSGNPSDFEYVLSVSLGASKQIADPNAALVLESVLEPASNDEFTIAVGPNGLLGNLKSTSEDQSRAIILKLAELIKESFKAAALNKSVTTADDDDARREACFSVLQKMSVTKEINLSDLIRIETARNYVAARTQPGAVRPEYSGTDPVERKMVQHYVGYLQIMGLQGAYSNGSGSLGLSDQVKALNREVWRAMRKVSTKSSTLRDDAPVREVKMEMKPRFPVLGSESQQATYVREEAKSYAGIVFRTMSPRRLSIDVSTSEMKVDDTCALSSVAGFSDGTTAMVADPTSTFVVDNSRAMFVKKKVDMAITDGVLVGMTIEKPSELLALVGLPVELVKIFLSAIPEILKVKVDQVKGQESLTSAQADLLKAQIELIKQTQAKMDAERTANTPN